MKSTHEASLVYTVDDDPEHLRLVEMWLRKFGYRVQSFEDVFVFLEMIVAKRPDAVVLDLRMPGMNGINVLKELQKKKIETPVIILTASDTAKDAFEAVKLGAYDYLVKPIPRERFIASVRNAVERGKLQNKVASLESELQGNYQFDNIIGTSIPMLKVFQDVRRVARSSISTCLFGESGTGKELIAKAIHYASPRKNQPFIAVNCAAIPESLQESEFFGYEKGAFTGAQGRHKGYFEQANGGTLFLDEIGEMDLLSQVKLLRVLQEKKVTRLGGNKSVNIDFRVICASNRSLPEMMQKKAFREDLFYRLAGYTIKLPALRERQDDLPLLIQFFVNKYRHEAPTSTKGFSADAMGALLQYQWPGNVRELENVVHSAIVVSDAPLIPLKALPLRILNKQDTTKIHSERVTLHQATGVDEIIPLEELEKRAILQALDLTGGNVELAAQKLQIGRATLYRKLSKYKSANTKNLKRLHI